jgi:hypothetical protein
MHSISLYSKSRRLPAIMLFVLLATLVLAGCSDEMDQFIQGRWATGDVHTWTEWNFDRGTYTYYFDYDNNRSNAFETGRYSVIESGEDYLVLELFNQQGAEPSIEDRVELRIEINIEEDTISIRRRKLNRIADSSLEALATARSQ